MPVGFGAQIFEIFFCLLYYSADGFYWTVKHRFCRGGPEQLYTESAGLIFRLFSMYGYGTVRIGAIAGLKKSRLAGRYSLYKDDQLGVC